MDAPAIHPDQFFHIRVVLGIVMGLSLARLLTGLARFVQHPGHEKIYLIHLGWVCFLLIAVIHFWWFEFGLATVWRWTFLHYLFVIFYAALFFFICVLLFPDRLDDYLGYADYFHSRQQWFYGLLAALFAVDIIDSALKGSAHLQALGPAYPIRQALLFVLAVIAMFVKDRRYHAVLVGFALVAEVSFILRRYAVLA